MSRNSIKKIVFILIIILLFASCVTKNINKQNAKSSLKESLFVSIALDNEYNKFYSQSAKTYHELYTMFDKEEYFNKSILLYHQAKKFKNVQILIENNIHKYPKIKQIMMKEYIVASVQVKEFDKAINMGQKLLDINNNAGNYTIVGDVFYLEKNYDEASKYYESAYNKNHDTRILLNLSDIFYTYMKKKKKAISYLETHHRQYSCDNGVCQKLFQYYQEEQNIDGMLSISTILLNISKKNNNKKHTNNLKNLIVELYIQKDISLAIEFLEKEKFDDKKLLNLYFLKKQYKNALWLVKKMHKKTKDDILLGQIAILEYELSDDKNNVLQNVIKYFEKSLNVKSNDSYENFYGYLLIDHDIDIKKGIKLVKKALLKSPNNFAYKDSLAYGYYKDNNCREAYSIMKNIINKIGLSNSDIRNHWNKIKNCKEKN